MSPKKLRISKLKTRETKLAFRKFDNLENCHFLDEKGESITYAICDPNSDRVKEFFKKTPPIRGSIFNVMATKSKNKAYDKRIITAIVSILPPEQMDIEHLLTQSK